MSHGSGDVMSHGSGDVMSHGSGGRYDSPKVLILFELLS
jgi:hypothetical protein